MFAKDKLSPLKKKFCDKLLNETDNVTQATLEVFPHLTNGAARVKGHNLLTKNNEVRDYLATHSKELQGHLRELALGARSENVQALCTINALDRILGKPIGSETSQKVEYTYNVLNYNSTPIIEGKME